MTLQSWLMYLGFVVIATSTPGPAVLFIITNSSLYGWRKAVFAALGNISGLLVLGIISITGLGTILTGSQQIFLLIKYAGAAYLVYMGLRMILKGKTEFKAEKWSPAAAGITNRRLFFKALGLALSNPKAIIFLTALFPQFIDIRSSLLPQFSMLILVLICFSFSFLMMYALLAHQARNLLTRPGRAKMVNYTGGSIFIGLGLLLAFSPNK
jgi:homoserine/homoserine lactone efflux protein